MSEPVGNAARTPGDVPSNTLKGRDAPKKEVAEDAPPAEKIVEGKVVTRKVPWYKRFASNLIADDATSMGDWIMQEVILPSVRNLISDAVKGSTDRVLYGSRGRAGGSILGNRGGSLRTRYDRMSEEREPRRLTREARARHDFDEVVLDSRSEAIEVIEALVDRAVRYKAVTVSDLYDLLGVTGSYADRSYGWSEAELRYADVRQTRGGYLLELPKPEPLR